MPGGEDDRRRRRRPTARRRRRWLHPREVEATRRRRAHSCRPAMPDIAPLPTRAGLRPASRSARRPHPRRRASPDVRLPRDAWLLRHVDGRPVGRRLVRLPPAGRWPGARAASPTTSTTPRSTMLNSWNTPWMEWVDRRAFGAHLATTSRCRPWPIASAHGPVLRGAAIGDAYARTLALAGEPAAARPVLICSTSSSRPSSARLREEGGDHVEVASEVRCVVTSDEPIEAVTDLVGVERHRRERRERSRLSTAESRVFGRDRTPCGSPGSNRVTADWLADPAAPSS